MSNKKTKTDWMRIEDIKVFRTADPKEMLNRYTAEQVDRKWTEDFTDEDTGELITIERAEIIERKGILIDKDVLQSISFHLQAGDLTDVLVSDFNVNSEKWIGDSQYPCEVVISNFPRKFTLLVRAQTIESAIQVATEYASVYGHLKDYYTIKKSEFKPYRVIEDDDPCIDEEETDNGNNQQPNNNLIRPRKEYYQATLKTMFLSADGEKMTTDIIDYILPAGDVGQAKERTMRYATAKFESELKRNPHNKIKVIKAKPYEVDAVPPLDYCELFYIEPSK